MQKPKEKDLLFGGFTNLDTVHFWHQNIQKDQFWPVLSDCLPSRHPVICKDQLYTVLNRRLASIEYAHDLDEAYIQDVQISINCYRSAYPPGFLMAAQPA